VGSNPTLSANLRRTLASLAASVGFAAPLLQHAKVGRGRRTEAYLGASFGGRPATLSRLEQARDRV
jgi:hypothetical protein